MNKDIAWEIAEQFLEEINIYREDIQDQVASIIYLITKRNIQKHNHNKEVEKKEENVLKILRR